jgi:hypothetical protein
MRIQELLEQTPVAPVGSSANPATVPAISNQPSDKPVTATSSKPPPTAADANTQKLAATLQQTGITKNPKEVNDFIGAYQASTTGKTLNPQQQAVMAKLAPAMMKDPNLDAKIKMMTAQKPGQQTAPGTAPPTVK